MDPVIHHQVSTFVSNVTNVATGTHDIVLSSLTNSLTCTRTSLQYCVGNNDMTFLPLIVQRKGLFKDRSGNNSVQQSIC